MATQIRRRRGNTSAHSSFVGAAGELTVDTTKNTVVVHDGETEGGHPLPTLDGVETLYNKTMASLLMSGAPRATDLTAEGLGQFLADLSMGRNFASRTEAEGLSTGKTGTALTIGVVIAGMLLGYIYDAAGTALTTGDGRTWSPLGQVHTLHFGAAEDCNQNTQTGTPDDAAIASAMAYAAAEHEAGVGGGIVWIKGRMLVTEPVVVPRGVKLKAVVPVTSSGLGSTADSAWPITYNEGSGIVGAHTSGPVVLLAESDTGAYGLTIGATETRRDAIIATGAQNTNAGILVEPEDVDGANIQRIWVEGCLVRDQPADAYYAAGRVFGQVWNRNHSHNCGRHGLLIDSGEQSGRTNLDRPGEIEIVQSRNNNLGGHDICIGHNTNTVGLPYRVRITGSEGYRCGNDPDLLLKSAGWFLNGEEMTCIGGAPAGTSGYSGNTAALDYAAWVAGRFVKFIGHRFIGYATKPVCVGAVSGSATRGIDFDGCYAATGATDPVFFAHVEAPVLGLWFKDIGGDFTGPPVDAAAAAAFGPTAFGSYVHEGEYVEWGISREVGPLETATGEIRNLRSYPHLTIADDAAVLIPITGTFVTGIMQLVGSTIAHGTLKIHFRAGTLPDSAVLESSGATIGRETVALTGTTGGDGKFNFSATADGIYVENRTGVDGNWTPMFLGVDFANGQLV